MALYISTVAQQLNICLLYFEKHDRISKPILFYPKVFVLVSMLVTTDYIQQEQANYAILLVINNNLCSFLSYDLSANLGRKDGISKPILFYPKVFVLVSMLEYL
jgi:ABC-type transport system involved in cytochrome c biogenesis permease component